MIGREQRTIPLRRTITRRGFLGAAAAAAASLPVGDVLAPGAGQAAFAEPASNARPFTARDIERFAKRIDLIRQSLDIPGLSVAVLHRQAVILARGFGIVDLAHGTKATENTPYPIASLTKTFATAVIMKLVDRGKLDLDEAMSTYDPGYGKWCASLKSAKDSPKDSPWSNFHCDSERITVREHLNHTEQGTPGTAFEYSAFLFARLTAVIDAVSDKGFLRSVQQDILEPLGMKDTALGTEDADKAAVIARMARAYRLDADWNLDDATSGRSFDRINASSGLISTVADLAKYDVGIDRDIVYSEQAKQRIWTPSASPSGEKFPYGLGWFVQGDFGSKAQLVWHYGLYPNAFSSLLFKVPDRQLTLILLACTERASSVFLLGNGDPVRSAFVTAFLDAFARGV
jgi:CubicO group peptidase (beta-lactamase class C family)